LLLGDHDSSHASTGPQGEFRCPSGPGQSIAVGVVPGGVSTGRWVVGRETGRRGSGGPCAPGHLVVVSRRDRRGRYDGGTAGSRCSLVISDKLLPTDLQQLSLTLHVEGFKSFDVSGKKTRVQVSAAYGGTDWTRAW